MWPDVVNAVFEALGGVAIFGHCVRLYKDKMVRGVYWPATAFFLTWGFWNIFYYSHLDQWWSWGAGLLIAAANTTWCLMMAYYIRRERHGQND